MNTGNGCEGYDTWDLYLVTVILFIQTRFERDRGADGNGKSKVKK